MKFAEITLPDAVIQDIRSVSDFIFTHPELGYQEAEASRVIAEFLQKYGFEVEHPFCGLPTALRAGKKILCGENTPCVCVIAEYDALPEMGHACGHNLITGAALTAAAAVAAEAEKQNLPLNFRLIGTPAEEGGGGKIRLLEKGAFHAVRMAVMAHPGPFTETDYGSLGVAHGRIFFHGKAAHATRPEAGKNALDAVVLFYSDIMKWRAELSCNEFVHGIITDGGKAANIIPALTEAFFYVRAATPERLAELRKRLEESAAAGAASAQCRWEVRWDAEYLPIKVNPALNRRFHELWRENGKTIRINQGNEGKASTDMGNVTQVIPGAQFHFSVTEEQPCSCHTLPFREASGTREAFENAVKTGLIMARILLDYSHCPAFQNQVDQAFNQCAPSVGKGETK